MDDFRSLCRHLRKAFPTVRVSVRISRMRNHYGLTSQQRDGGFLIRISPELCEGGRIAFLIHEFAHVLSFHTDHHPTMHGLQYGGAYSIVWEKYLEWIESDAS